MLQRMKSKQPHAREKDSHPHVRKSAVASRPVRSVSEPRRSNTPPGLPPCPPRSSSQIPSLTRTGSRLSERRAAVESGGSPAKAAQKRMQPPNLSAEDKTMRKTRREFEARMKAQEEQARAAQSRAGSFTEGISIGGR